MKTLIIFYFVYKILSHIMSKHFFNFLNVIAYNCIDTIDSISLTLLHRKNVYIVNKHRTNFIIVQIYCCNLTNIQKNVITNKET